MTKKVIEKTYSKKEILELAKAYGKLEDELSQTALEGLQDKFDQTTLEKRLNDIVEFIKNDQNQQLFDNVGGYFYNQEMDILNDEGSSYKSYNYRVFDAILLAVLVSLYNQPLFKKLRTHAKINNPDQEEEAWVNVYRTKLKSFEAFWDTCNDSRPWDVIVCNLESLLYSFTLLTDMTKDAAGQQNELQAVVDLFNELPDNHKITFYDKVMKNRINYVHKYLVNYIDDLRTNDLDEYRYYKAYQRLVEIDEEIDSDESHELKKVMDVTYPQHELQTVVGLFAGFPDDHKITVYNKVMKSRINYIQKRLVNYIDDLAKNDLD